MDHEKLSFLDAESRQYVEEISNKIRDNRVILFAGAGLSRNAQRKDGKLDKKFPLWEDLSKEMLSRLYGKDEKRIEKEKRFYLETADKFEAVFGRTALLHLLDEMLEDSEFEPGEIHRLISRFNWEIITTNFDTLIEQGYESNNKVPNLIYVDQDLSFIEQPRIFKINGCIKKARDMIIISGEDFRKFSEKKPLLELYVKKCFIESTILFVGFSLDDPTFKMIHGWVRDRLLDKGANRYAYSIQLYTDEKNKRIWNPRGINFIDLFPDENIANGLAEQRLNQLFLYLYEKQSDDKKKKITPDANNDVLEKIKNTLIEKLAQVGQKAEAYYADLKLECPDIQNKLVKDLIESFENVRPLNFFEFIFYVFECDKKEIEISGQNIIDYFIHVVDTYLFKEAKETVLFKLLKEMAECLDKKKVFENEKIITGFRKILERFIFKADTDDLNNPNIWVLSMYIGLWLCQYQKLPSLSFFKKGFSILRKTATNGSIEQRVAMDLHPYWLSILQLIGPFMCAENMVKICRKTTLQKNEWEIPKNIHFHLEVFFDNRLKHLALFLTVVNNLRTTNDTEAYYKFLLLENFLKEYQNSHLEFSDLFIENSYKTLSGKFRKEISDYKDSLSDIHYPIKSRYFQKILHTIFQEMLKGRSLLFTDIATFILSLPTFEMSEEALNIFKKTSLGELVLLSMIYDIPEDEKKKQQDLKRFMMFMIEKQLIDVSYFLNLLLFRVDEIKMEELEQESDNGISRYFNGLVSYISCALPYLEDDDLKSIKKIIQNCLSGLKIRMIREFLVKNVVGYLASQLSEDDFSTIYEDIFSLAERDALDSPLFEFLTISPKDAKHLKYGRFRLILDKNLDKLGTSADRDFVLFLLNHKREDIIPSDETIEKQLEIYFKNKFADTSHLSLQWLMDLQNFIEKGYIALDGNTEKRVKEFFEQASKDNAFYFEWKLFAEKMIPVYKRFSHLMEPGLVGKIMEGFLKNAIGNEMKLNELTETQVNGFAHQLKEIYECLYHQELKDKAMGYAKDMINKGLPGGGYLSAFWDGLVEDEKKHLGELMISLWRPPDEKTVIKAIQATSKFLKYPTDKATEAELTNLVTYTALYNSPRLKIETIKLFSLHAGQNTDWFQEYRERVLNLLPYLHIEKDLNLLRQLILFLRPLTDDRAKESINYLRHEAPYAEIRRAAQ